jgi:hypothetical protein
MNSRINLLKVLVAVTVTGVSLWMATAAGAYTTAPGYLAHDYATGFPNSEDSAGLDYGPMGVAFDKNNDLYVADTDDGNIYRFPPGGGVASSATRLTPSPISGEILGLAISRSGALYVARYKSGDVLQVDPTTGQVIRTVANVQCATGIAVDPMSGDLFVSENRCGTAISRISGFANGPGTVTTYANARGVDGLAFDSNGTLYAEGDGTILKINGTNSQNPGQATSIAYVSQADGIVFGAHAAGTSAPFLAVNRNDGIVTQVSTSSNGPSETNIFTGGSRGDLAAVDSFGCLYITQSDRVVRISGTGDTCQFQPTTPGVTPPPPVEKGGQGQKGGGGQKSCVALKTVTVRLKRPDQLRSATIFLNGRKVRNVRGSSLRRPILITHLRPVPLTVKIVATTTNGHRLISYRRWANCGKLPPLPSGPGTSPKKKHKKKKHKPSGGPPSHRGTGGGFTG